MTDETDQFNFMYGNIDGQPDGQVTVSDRADIVAHLLPYFNGANEYRVDDLVAVAKRLEGYIFQGT